MSIKPFKPMLAEAATLAEVQFPVYASPKLDGIRAMVRGGALVTRKLLDVPSEAVREKFILPQLEGMDGELIAGSATSKTCMNDTTRAVMRIKAKESEPTLPVSFHVFDMHDMPSHVFEHRLDHLQRQVEDHCDGVSDLVVVEQKLIGSPTALLAYEEEQLDLGYEGLILRTPRGTYKHGAAR